MSGGPSQLDTFDPKPEHANGGDVRAIDTNVVGLKLADTLPRLARHANDLAIVRAMSSREADHGRATYHLHTGYLPLGSIQYPTLGSLVARENGPEDLPLPGFVSISPFRQFNQAAFSSGFLGPNYAAMTIAEQRTFGPITGNVEQILRVEDMEAPEDIEANTFDARVALVRAHQRDFAARHSSVAARSHAAAYERAVRLMHPNTRSAFHLDTEPNHLRDAYGRTVFGQGCMIARRLVERGVPFVEINLGNTAGSPAGWDTHGQNRDQTRRLCEILDPAFATLIEDLKQRGLLESTLIVWMGEFGRTPQINGQAGRDHYATAWSTALAGGGIRGGQAYGRTSADGRTVEGVDPVSVPHFLATVCAALGIDHTKQNLSNVGRPIRITDNGEPIRALVS